MSVEVWDRASGNRLAEFLSLAQAGVWLDELVRSGGPTALDGLALGQDEGPLMLTGDVLMSLLPSGGDQPAVPKPPSVHADWQERIAHAKEARAVALKLCQGKPTLLPAQWPIHLRQG